MIEAIRNEIRARHAELGFSGEPSVLQVGGASWRGGRVHFAVIGSDGRPTVFARLTRNPGDDTRLQREHELLSRLAASAHFSAHVPAPVFFSEVDGRPLLCERAALGGRLIARRRRSSSTTSFAEQLGIAVPLAVKLARAAAEEVGRDEFERLALDPLRAFWLSAGGSAREVAPVLRAVMDVIGSRPRLVVTHGDFIAKNILVDGERAVLIDWETATAHGLPLVDLLYFITRSAYLSGPPWRDKMDRVRRFYARKASARTLLASRALTQYCRALDLPVALLGPMVRLHFLYKARIKAETTSLDNSVTQKWLELFAESAATPQGFA